MSGSFRVFCRQWLVLLVTLAVGCGSKGDGLVKQAVTGVVKINGVPRKGVIVSFWHTDPDVKGNAAEPVSATDEEGRFSLSTNGTQDGAVAGEYIVTFSWPDKSGAVDFLRNKYSNRQKSEFRVTVGEGDQETLPFELTAKTEDVDAALADQEKKKAMLTQPTKRKR